MANKNNGSGNGSNVPWWVEKTLWRLEAAEERHDTMIKLQRDELSEIRKETAEIKKSNEKRDIEIAELKKANKEQREFNHTVARVLNTHNKVIPILAREILKERGWTDKQIDNLLKAKNLTI